MSDTLIVKSYGGLGDLLMLTPALREYSTRIDKQLDIAVSSRHAPSFENLPYIENIISVEHEQPFEQIKSNFSERYATIRNVCNYEYLGKALSRFPHKNNIDFYAEKLGVSPSEYKIDIVLTEDENKSIDTYLDTNRLDQDKLVLMAVRADSEKRTWPLHNWKDLASMIISRGYHVIICDPNASWEQDNLHFYTGRTVREYFALASRAAVSISNDSSLQHISAGAFENPHITIFGPTDPEQTCIYPSSRAVVAFARGLRSYDISDIPVLQVYKAFREVVLGAK